MRRTATIGLCLLVVQAGCSSPQPDVKVRALSSAPRADDVAQAQAQLALGNVGTALQGFRKILREQPHNVQASLGIAHSYERMGRFDISRKWFETALAAAPDDPAVLGAFAASLERQGKVVEAASVRQEAAEQAALQPAAEEPVAIAADVAEAEAGAEIGSAAVLAATAVVPLEAAPAVAISSSKQPLIVPTSPAIVPQIATNEVAVTAPKRSVTVTLPPPSEPAKREAATDRPALSLAAATAKDVGAPRLERLSMGEVALVTKGTPVWTGQLVAKSSRSATFRWVPVRTTARLLNAARKQGLAARTRAHLAELGWKRIEIGDAPKVRAKTLVLYPAFRRGTAQRLAAQFGFTELKRFNGSEIVVLLGRDAAAMKILRPA